eukprot:816477-Pleurochrysis_carterae.AAC.4
MHAGSRRDSQQTCVWSACLPIEAREAWRGAGVAKPLKETLALAYRHHHVTRCMEEPARA